MSYWASEATHTTPTECTTSSVTWVGGGVPVEMGTCWLIVLLRLDRLPLGAEAGRALVYVLGKILLSHAEVLIFKLLYPTFKGSVFVPELNELCVDFVYRSDLWGDVLQRPCSKLSVLGVTLLHYILDLS